MPLLTQENPNEINQLKTKEPKEKSNRLVKSIEKSKSLKSLKSSKSIKGSKSEIPGKKDEVLSPTNNVTTNTAPSLKSMKSMKSLKNKSKSQKKLTFGGDNIPRKLNLDRIQNISFLPTINSEDNMDKHFLNYNINNFQDDRILLQQGDTTLLSLNKETDDLFETNNSKTSKVHDDRILPIDIMEDRWSNFSK